MSIGTPGERGDILRLKRTNNYQLACLKHFEIMHPGALSVPNVEMDNVGNHPNAWFSASVSYHAKRTGTATNEIEEKAKAVSPEKVDEE